MSIGARERTRVVRDLAPTLPEFVGDSEFVSYVRRFEFIGRGRAESQAVNNPLLSGVTLPDTDRAPGTGASGAVDVDPTEPSGVTPIDQCIECVRSTDLRIVFGP